MSTRRSKRSPWVPVILALLGAKLLLLVVMAPDIRTLIPGAPLSLPAVAQAQDTPDQPQQGLLTEEQFLESVQERRYQQILEREEQARLQDDKLRQEQERLGEVKRELNLLLEQLNQLQAKVESTVKEREEKDEATLNRLARMYEETPPESAAPMLSQLSPELAAKIIMRMSPRKAGKIWGAINPEIGQRITQELVKLSK